MATVVKTKQGTWRALVRREGKYASQAFRLKSLTWEWAVETGRMIYLGGEPDSGGARDPKTLADLIDLPRCRPS